MATLSAGRKCESELTCLGLDPEVPDSVGTCVSGALPTSPPTTMDTAMPTYANAPMPTYANSPMPTYTNPPMSGYGDSSDHCSCQRTPHALLSPYGLTVLSDLHAACCLSVDSSRWAQQSRACCQVVKHEPQCLCRLTPPPDSTAMY